MDRSWIVGMPSLKHPTNGSVWFPSHQTTITKGTAMEEIIMKVDASILFRMDNGLNTAVYR